MVSYNDKMKAIRKVVSFNYDLRQNLTETLTPAEKRQISIYYNSLSGILQRDFQVYRGNKKNIKVLMDNIGYTIPLKNLKYLPIEIKYKEKKKYSVRKGSAKIIGKKFAQKSVSLNNKRMVADDWEDYLRERFKKLGKSKYYRITFMGHEVNGFMRDVEGIITEIKKQMLKYSHVPRAKYAIVTIDLTTSQFMEREKERDNARERTKKDSINAKRKKQRVGKNGKRKKNYRYVGL